MKSLHNFLFIVIKREDKFQGSLWENEKPKYIEMFSEHVV